MTEFQEGVLVGMAGCLVVGSTAAIVAVWNEFRKTYWNTSLSIDNWDKGKAAAYGNRAKDSTGD